MSKFVFYVTCLYLVCKVARVSLLSTSVRQERRLISTHVGESITLQCFCDRNVVAWLYWYKQTLGQKPRRISSFYKYSDQTFYDEYKDNPRFALETSSNRHHLNISDLRSSDSATYYCASKHSVLFEFGGGATVIVNGGGSNVQQSGPETILPGGSVTLNCTVHAGTCDGGHSVYWFKDSGESHPGLIYTHGGRNDKCERKPETQTNTCIYNLLMKNLNFSHAGTYYCAVASCGQILFGKGTKLDVEDKEQSFVLVYSLSSALAFTTILSVLLALFLYMISQRNRCQGTDSNARFTASSTMTAESYINEESLHYAALKVNRSRRQKDGTEDGCLYSSIKQ